MPHSPSIRDWPPIPIRWLGLPCADLRLMDDSHYPWLMLIPRIAGARDLIDLDAAPRHVLSDEIDRASRLLRDAFAPHKLNVAALGNVVAQLHVHVIARFEDDPAWPAPDLGQGRSTPLFARRTGRTHGPAGKAPARSERRIHHRGTRRETPCCCALATVCKPNSTRACTPGGGSPERASGLAARYRAGVRHARPVHRPRSICG